MADMEDAERFIQLVEELLAKLKVSNPTWSEEELQAVAEEMAYRDIFPNKEAERPH